MKWHSKGHEFDLTAEKYIKIFKESGEQIYIFGAGYLGNEVRSVVERLGCFAGYIDNDIRKQKSGVDGIRVESLEQYVSLEQKGIIVIAVGNHVSEITEQMTGENLFINKDYFMWDDFLKRVVPILMTYYYNLSYVELAQISVTERCSLRCKKCAHACNYVDQTVQDMTINQVYDSADAFFSKVDLCREFVLIGGEPLLYRNLAEAVRYIGEKYRKQMIHFCITTNGTILPDRELVEACRKYDVMFRISNYSEQIPRLPGKLKKLTEMLSANQVEYTIEDADGYWMDYGFDYMNRDCDENGLQEVFDTCLTPCREIRGSKYYYCVMARSVSENMGKGVGMDDFLDLGKLPADHKKILMEFEMGYSEKGYLDMCRYCNGADSKNFKIPIAEQVEV